MPAMRCAQRRNGSLEPRTFASQESGNFSAKPVTASTMKLAAKTKCCQRCDAVIRTTGRSVMRSRAAVFFTNKIPLWASIPPMVAKMRKR